MPSFIEALRTGILSGAQTRTRDAALLPQRYGLSDSISQGLYWLGFEVANIVVYGARR